mmetsp:Transcript_53415/g.158092  ORF Transcript_53415/g.158092 Transcript_53415/m.158092 type:complete len:222 (-) Transcript_53415:186-851(-)
MRCPRRVAVSYLGFLPTGPAAAACGRLRDAATCASAVLITAAASVSAACNAACAASTASRFSCNVAIASSMAVSGSLARSASTSLAVRTAYISQCNINWLEHFHLSLCQVEGGDVILPRVDGCAHLGRALHRCLRHARHAGASRRSAPSKSSSCASSCCARQDCEPMRDRKAARPTWATRPARATRGGRQRCEEPACRPEMRARVAKPKLLLMILLGETWS